MVGLESGNGNGMAKKKKKKKSKEKKGEWWSIQYITMCPRSR